MHKTIKSFFSINESKNFHPVYRQDIDGLRGFAVLAVLIYHIFPNFIQGGFIGVDIFFVISGYLISGIIIKSLFNNNFSLKEFFIGRVNRIFPVLILVLSSSLIFGFFILLVDELRNLGKHVAYGAIFLSNMILLGEFSYFDKSALSKPLMHLWSLGVEEQFYLFWPFLLYFVRKIKLNILMAIVIVFVTSFFFNILLNHVDLMLSFYHPITRLWEFLAGGCISYFSFTGTSGNARTNSSLALLSNKTSKDIQSIIGIFLILISLFSIGSKLLFPGWWALLPVTGSALLIASGSASVINRKLLSIRIIVWFGSISYPLYLWHWPLTSFVYIIHPGELTSSLRASILLLSIILAWLTHRFIEKPVKSIRTNRSLAIINLVLLMITGLFGIYIFKKADLKFRTIDQKYKVISEAMQWNYLEDKKCENHYKAAPCQTNTDKPEIMIMGDSHANHLYPGLVEKPENFKVLQLGKCAPLDSVLMKFSKSPENRCSEDINLKVLENLPSVKTAIISAFWEPLLSGEIPSLTERERFGEWIIKSYLSDEKNLKQDEVVYNALSRTIEKLTRKKINVIITFDVPFLTIPFKEYCKIGRQILTPIQDCTISIDIVHTQRMRSKKLIENIKKKYSSVIVFDPLDDLCDQYKCYLIKNHQLLYRNEDHLNKDGSIIIGKRLKKIIMTFNKHS